ncbi:poly-beta-1,6-N-acetyl-D-glucosamine N-deacetylase PgaB [Acinetobacter sp. 194]|uniref:poly-beta-1,6-N-acetyl-D-glucosamine N-deacetylase PgaB n=1 Tax=Acinetobacter shaoyimingii TaxID=2715164 RepID=UPI00140AB9C7|nr:poly-beta-1,6-N-acetyl-D-glucosamine N-deacetylase PgaB [Acinetobacter shaoyimingii]NHB57150.1 poly-beta-1,6-N-acetyl-D-glucosamine N-deacetylase PgaB [Acinetobacter shaoyimingii]
MKFFSRCIAACLMSLPVLSQAEYNETLPENSFIGITFHDVRSDVLKQGDKDYYAISTKNLVQFFEWLNKSKWQPITLKQLSESVKTGKPLPENAVLICFDDGALSSYTQVFPLLKQYKMPAVFAVVTSWTNGNTKAAYEAYGQGNLMNWDQMREMSKSGYAEFATHSHDLHKGILSNPQKNEQPAAVTHQYFPHLNRYETDAEYEQRIFKDLAESKAVLEKELGTKIDTVIWPYGAVNVQVQNIAAKAGLPLSFSLGKDSLNFPHDGSFQRGLIMGNPTVEEIHEQMTSTLNYTVYDSFNLMRSVTFDLSDIQSPTYDEGNIKLGKTLENLNALKTNTMILKVLKDVDGDGVYDQAFFPNQYLPVAQDLMNRVSWQTRTRVFHSVYAELPLYPDPKRPNLVMDLAANLIQNNKNLDGLMLQVGETFDCSLKEKYALDGQCEQQMNQTVSLIRETKKRTRPYLNISNTLYTAVQFPLKNTSFPGLPRTVSDLIDHIDIVNIKIDPIQQPEVFKKFLAQKNQLNAVQRAKILVTLDGHAKTEKEWKYLQKSLLDLQAAGFQKTGIGEYSEKNAQAVHKYLYTPLSLNGSPLTYREPFVLQSKLGVRK